MERTGNAMELSSPLRRIFTLEDQGGVHVHFPPVVLAVRTLLAVSTAGFGRIPFYLASAATLPRCGRRSSRRFGINLSDDYASFSSPGRSISTLGAW